MITTLQLTIATPVPYEFIIPTIDNTTDCV